LNEEDEEDEAVDPIADPDSKESSTDEPVMEEQKAGEA
jgi:hypothetical protein